MNALSFFVEQYDTEHKHNLEKKLGKDMCTVETMAARINDMEIVMIGVCIHFYNFSLLIQVSYIIPDHIGSVGLPAKQLL